MPPDLQIYERLSGLYDLDWGKWPRLYMGLIGELLSGRAVARAKILDLACGTGTLAVDLGRLGHSVLGIDIAPEMIEVARSKAAGLDDVSFQVQDMLAFDPPDRFDCVTCTFDSLNYLLHVDQLRAVVQTVVRALEPGGLFVFDSNTDRLYRARHKGTHARTLGGRSFLQRLRYDAERRIATTVFEFSDGTEEIHRQRPYDLDEIKPILGETGLGILRATSGFDGTPYTVDSERLICVASKREKSP
jgi:SAM-dependent methyltransferase